MSTIVTGGKGKLAGYLKEIQPDFIYLGRDSLNVADSLSVNRAFDEYNPTRCIHLAANTDVAFCERDHEAAYNVNTVGSRNIANACIHHSTYAVLTSTDYVFDGEKGQYTEHSPPNPINYYGLTKLLAEFEMKRVPNHLIIRGTMKQTDGWRHPKVPNDMFESILFYDEFACISLALMDLQVIGVVHIGKERYNIFEVAKSRRSDVTPIKLTDIKTVKLPRDCSLNVSKMRSLIDLDLVLRNVPKRL